MEKEAELFRALDYLSKELGKKQAMTEEQMWEVFHICSDTAAIYRHITDYFSTLDKAILEARIKNGQLKQELYELKKDNEKLREIVNREIDGF